MEDEEYKISLLERLNDIISEKDKNIVKLRNELKSLKKNCGDSWNKVTDFKESKLQSKLPVPRLEMRLSKVVNGRYEYEWTYGIVYKHFGDTFDENNKFIFIPISSTSGRGGNYPYEANGKLMLPFRDYVHILSEMKLFNLPAYIICEDVNVYNEIEFDEEVLSKSSYEKMIRK